MQTIEAAENCLTPVPEFRPDEPWDLRVDSAERSRWCCERLEENRVLYFDTFPFEFPEADRKFLISQRLGDSRFHKNISYRPKQDILRGFSPPDPAVGHQMHEVMRRYSTQVLKFLAQLLAPYSNQWSLDYASFRPEAEQDRKLPLRKRNDLLHTDAFPSRPTHGGRILRCFTNINPTEARVWQTTDSFPRLATDYGIDAGLMDIAERPDSAFKQVLLAMGRSLGLKYKNPSRYDLFMLRFHDFLKENAAFQENCRKVILEFPPGSTWICFTDSVPHAVVRGQYAVEQTLIVPIAAMVNPENAPLRVLERLAGQPLAP